MRNVLDLLMMIAVGFALSILFGSWIIIPIGLLSGIFNSTIRSSKKALGFVAGILLWGGYALYIDAANQSLMSRQMGILFGGLNTYILILITAFIGGILLSLSRFVGICLRSQG